MLTGRKNYFPNLSMNILRCLFVLSNWNLILGNAVKQRNKFESIEKYDTEDDFASYLYNRDTSRHYGDNIKKDRNEDYFDKFDEDNDDRCQLKDQFRFKKQDFVSLYDRIHKIVLFFERNADAIIVDGLYGVRSTEGVLKNILKSLHAGYSFYRPIHRLYEKTRQVANYIFEKITYKADEYTKSFLPLINKAFDTKIQIPWHHYNKHSVWSKTNGIRFAEEKSDDCIKLLFGISGKTSINCQITEECFHQATATKTKGYILTHQLLYFLVGENEGCHGNISEAFGSNKKMMIFLDTFSSNVFSQMKLNPKGTEDVDKFSEQGFVCASLGVIECINVHQLRKAFDWVSNTGCVIVDQETTHKRMKRSDTLIGNCSQHTTTVLLGYFAQHLRFMMNPPDCDLIGNGK